MRDVKPYFVPSKSSVTPGPWQRFNDGEWEPLEAYLDDWDQRTTLSLRCVLTCDPSRIRGETGLGGQSPLAWSFSWRATDSGLVGTPTIVDFGEPDVEVVLSVPPERAGGTLVLTRRLFLRRDRVNAGPGQARYAGSILWGDEIPLTLVGTGTAFPTEVIDFAALNRDAGASWYLDLPTAVDGSAMGSMILMINAADRELVVAATKAGKPTDFQRALLESMEEGMVEELVRWGLTHWDQLEDVDPDSVGAIARSLINRVLPDPDAWTGTEVDAMALKAAVVSGARRIGHGRKLA